MFGETTMTSLKAGDLTTAVLLAELNSALPMPRTFFAERILVQITHLSDGWLGKTTGISRFCPRSLPIGTEVVGPIVNGHHVINAKLCGDTAIQVEAEEVGKGGTFALMVCPRDDPSFLQSANPFCPNPTCVNVCSLTYSKIDQALNDMTANLSMSNLHPKAHWQCNLCGATMLVDREAFSTLYKM